MKKISLSINGNVYVMPRKKAMDVMKIAKEHNKGKNVIVGLAKGHVIECRLDEYDSAQELLDASKEWIKQGYKVYSQKCYKSLLSNNE